MGITDPDPAMATTVAMRPLSTAAGRNQLPKPRCAAAGSDIRLLLVAEPHSQQRKVDTQEAGSVRPSRLSIRVFFPLSETSLDPLGTVGRNSEHIALGSRYWRISLR